MEANIYPLGVFLDEQGTIFKRDFFYNTPNRLEEFISIDKPHILSALRLIAVHDYRPDHHLDLVMDSQKSRAVAFLAKDEPKGILEEEQ
jgi:hypothetical protein